jgi:hypothetical protein
LGFEGVIKETVQPLELAVVFIVETFSWMIFYHTFYNYCKRNKYQIDYSVSHNKATDILCAIILLIYIAVRVSSLGASEDEPSAWEQRLFFIIPYVRYCGFVLAFFIVFSGRRFWGQYVWYLAIIAAVLYLVGAMLSGIRGTIVQVVVWSAYVVYLFKGKRQRVSYYCCFVLVLFCFSLVQQTFMGFRQIDNDLSLEDKIEYAKLISSRRSLKAEKRYSFENTFYEIDSRYGAQSTYAVGFYRLVKKEGYVGLNCIMNSFYTFVPSVIYGNDKPVSTSSDGTESGMGMYKCMNAVNGSSSMTGFFTSAHAYWELGIFGVILFSIIPAMFAYHSIRLFRKLDIIGLSMYISLFAKGFFEIKLWVSLIVMQFAQVILPVLLLTILYAYLKRQYNS